MSFTNCHIHIFNIDNVPDNFLPFGLVKRLQRKRARKVVGWLLRNIVPFTDNDLLDRYENFMNVAGHKSQEDVFKQIQGYYPPKTRFVVLPMDMEQMCAGKVKVGVEQQLQDLSNLYKKQPDIVIPFIPVDPRRKNILDFVKRYAEDHQFKGIKIYPRLGFYPTDERLMPVYEYAQKNNLPVLSHCSKGGVYTKEITDAMLQHPRKGKVGKEKAKKFSHYFTEPLNYDQLMGDFPNLRLCLAHFGGNTEWDKYLDSPWHPDSPDSKNRSWVSDIVDLMEKHPNLYTDISYTAFHSDKYFPLMSVLLENTKIRNKIMFGSDYYMIEREKASEREMSLKIRYALGEEKFKLISDSNISTFLGEK